ncbi:MAG: type III-A CRISPR-associated protein Csm2 [Deltaproteobacteria bacterium]|nr:type III-A CRISPR-associated protein Csm2 [Deltaproteobacteria bacterium]
MITLWKDREQGIVDPTLFSKTAEDWAKKLKADGTVLNKKGEEQTKFNKQSQLRRFFDEVVRLNDMAKNRQSPVPMSLVLPSLHMLIAKASYAQGRELVSPSFVELMRGSIEQIKDDGDGRKDLQVFTNFFESLMAFYKLYDPKN